MLLVAGIVGVCRLSVIVGVVCIVILNVLRIVILYFFLRYEIVFFNWSKIGFDSE